MTKPLAGKQAYRKFKLVPIDEDSDELGKSAADKLERYVRKYNPTIRAMANSYGGMQDALFSKNTRLTPAQRLHIYNANRARIHRMNKSTDVSKDSSSKQVEQLQNMVANDGGQGYERAETLKERLQKEDDLEEYLTDS